MKNISIFQIENNLIFYSAYFTNDPEELFVAECGDRINPCRS